MVQLVEINESNWLEAASLKVSDDQKKFLDSALGIIARGYVYRFNRAKVIGISDGEKLIGIALVKDMDEEPAVYDIQQFMIESRFQNKGYGTKALELILSRLSEERKYDKAEVCVNKDDLPALRVYQKLGFKDTGYIDDNVPDCLNLMYCFP